MRLTDLYDPRAYNPIPDVAMYSPLGLPNDPTGPSMAPMSTSQNVPLYSSGGGYGYGGDGGDGSDANPPDPTPPPAPPSAPPAASGGYTVNGNPTNAFINAFYPGYSVQNGQFVYSGKPDPVNGLGGGSMSDPTLAANYINSLWNPYSQGNYQQFFSTLRGNADPTVESMNSYWPILTQLGFTRPTHAGNKPSDDKLRTPGGQMFDVITDVGGPNAAWGWNPADNAGANQLLSNDQLGPLIQPWTETFNTPLPTYAPPAVPEYGAFAPPNPTDVYNDPSVRFREQLATDAILNSGAAQGRSLEGGFLKGLSDYASNFASQEYGNLFQRDLTGYLTNRDTALGRYNLGLANYNAGFNTEMGDYDKLYQQYLDREKAFRQNEQDAYDRLTGVARGGQNAASVP